MNRSVLPAACLLALTSCSPAHAQAAQPVLDRGALTHRALAFDIGCCTAPPGWNKIGQQRLDGQRGGFDLPSGLTMSLGIERLVSINGQVVAQNSFNIANVASMTGDEARQAREAFGGARLIQNGPGNFAAAPAFPGTYVQNTLNGQTIGTQTVISANVNSASLLKDLNFNAGVRDAGLRAIPTH